MHKQQIVLLPPGSKVTLVPCSCQSEGKKSGGHLATDPKFGAGYDAIFGKKPTRRPKLPTPSVN